MTNLRQATLTVFGTATVCCIMPFVAGYSWIYGGTGEKLLNGFGYSALVFAYVSFVLGIIAIPLAIADDRQHNISQSSDNYQI